MAAMAAEEFFVERTSHDDAERAIGSHHSLPFRCVMKLAGKSAQNSHLGITRPETGPRQQFARLQRLARAKRIANGAHAAGQRSAQQRPQHRRKQMSVLVSIHVGDTDASRLDLANLRARLSFDLVRIQSGRSGRVPQMISSHPGKRAATRISRRDDGQANVRIENRLAIDQYHVAAHTRAAELLLPGGRRRQRQRPFAISVDEVTIPRV